MKRGNGGMIEENGPKYDGRQPRKYSRARRIGRVLGLLFWLLLGFAILALSSGYFGYNSGSGQMTPWW